MIYLASVTIESGWLITISIVVVIILFNIVLTNADLKKTIDFNKVKVEGILREKDLIESNSQMEIQSIKAEMKTFEMQMREEAGELAKSVFEKWKEMELQEHKKKADESGLAMGRLMLDRWKIDEEYKIRKDATNRSVRVVLGKATENLVPFTEAFPYNPRDRRFIGSPIDLIVFDGMEEKEDDITIIFIEVKTGSSALSPKQKKIRDAVKYGRVKWDLISLKDFGDAVNDELKENF